MKLVKQSTLYFKDEKSDKVYEVDLCETPSGEFLVNFRYGRRGANLREGTKTTSPVDREAAEKLFDELVASKTKKGYAESTDTPVAKVVQDSPGQQSTNEVLDARCAAVLARLKIGLSQGEKLWSLSRTVWRAGELRLVEAESLLKGLVGEFVMLNYSIAWALGRIGLESSLPALEVIAQANSSPPHLDDMVEESMRLCSSDSQRKAMVDQKIKSLPAALKAAYDSGSAETFLAAFTDHLTSADLDAAKVMNLVYFIDDQVVRPGLISVLDHVPFRVNYFRSLRRLFKTAELRGDAEVFGILGRRLEIEPGTFSKASYWGSCKPEALARDDSQFGFSKATKHYLRARIWRRLRQLGSDKSDQYVPMAVGVLLPFKDSDAEASPPTSTYCYNWNTQQSGYLYREAMGTFWAFNQILNRNSGRHVDVSLKSGFYLRSGLTPDSPKTPVGSGFGAFPELWKKQPKGLLHLLMESQCERVHEFAVPVIKECSDFTGQLDLKVINRLLQKPYDATLSLAVDLAVDRYDPGNPDFELVLTLCHCQLERARDLAFGWIAKDRRHFFADQDFAFSGLTSEYADTRMMASESINSMTSDDKFKEGLVAKLLTYLQGLGQPATIEADSPEAAISVEDGTLGNGIVDMNAPVAEEDVQNSGSTEGEDTPTEAEVTGFEPESDEIAADVSKALLNSYFKNQVETLGEDVLCDLLASSVIEVQSFAAEVVLRHRELKDKPTERILGALLNATHSPVRAVGIRVLSELSDAVLTGNVELLVQLTSHPLEDIRAEIRPVAKRLANKDQKFSNELIAMLIDRIQTPGAPRGVPTHLSIVLREDYGNSMRGVSQNTVWNLLKSRSAPAQEVGGFLLPTNVKPQFLKVIEIVKLASHDILTVREAAWKMYDSDVPRMEKSLVTAVRILDSKWEDSREFGFEYIRNRIDPAVLTPESMISICDSVRPDVQQFGRELITREFTEDAGPEYLLKLSEHPTADLQLFVTNYLTDFGSDNLQRLESLEPYFVSILSRVNRSRVAKDRVYSFLQMELQKSEEAATIIAPILDRISATCAIGDKATTIELMLELKEKYPNIELPIEIKPVEAR